MADFLKLRAYVERSTELYKTRPKNYNALVIGDLGTGKTRLAVTCRKPVLLHTFDPGGSKTRDLQPLIESGDIIPDPRFEVDDARNPTAFKEWDREMPELKKMGIFDHLGTFMVDSITSLGSAVMNQILKENGRANSQPQLPDYMKQQLVLVNIIKDLMNLPCDVIMTGHIGMEKDEVTGKMVASLFVSGQLIIKIPLLFDEVYITQAKSTSKGVEYKLLTTKDDPYQARTRIGGGVFEKYEEPDIKRLLKKAGYPCDDKPRLSTLE